MREPPLHAWSSLKGPVRPLSGGLINSTFVVGEPPQAVIQCLHPVFGPRVNEDIEAVTEHLAAGGMMTPRLLRTDEGALWVEADGIWRVLSWVPGHTHNTLRDPALAAQAGALVARWHRAVEDLEHDFAFRRPLAHDTAHHMAVLEQALAEHPAHPLADDVARLAQELFNAHARLGAPDGLTLGITHGDLKISNLRFDEQGRGLCLLDLDTLGRLPLSVELGDAWRSWCNRATEDAAATRFDLQLFEASAHAYLAERPLAPEVLEVLPGGVQRICVELSARFAADALRESYFGWDSSRFETRGQHNLLRARGQAALARSVGERLSEMERILKA